MIGKILNHYRVNGVALTVKWGGRRIAERLVFLRKSYVVARNLDREPTYIKAKIDVEFKIAGPGDFETLKEHRLPWKYYSSVFEDRINRGVTGIVGFMGSQAVGYIWLTSCREKDRNLGFTITPADDEIYGLDLYVLPEYRKDLVGYELISLWLKQACEAGKKRAIGVVAEWNKPMLMTTRLVFGFRIIKTMYSLEFFKKRGFLIHTSATEGVVCGNREFPGQTKGE